MKRASTDEQELPQKRAKIEEVLPKTSRPLTEQEKESWRLAKTMFDTKKHPDVKFEKTNPLDKRTLYWFHCHEHDVKFERSLYRLIIKPFKHQICKKKRMATVAPHLEPYFHSSEGGLKFAQLSHGSNEMCTWVCENAHSFKLTPKQMIRRRAFFCEICKTSSNSLKQLHPKLEPFFINSTDGKAFDEVARMSHNICTWWCDKKLHKVQFSPHAYVAQATHGCGECFKKWQLSMDCLYPNHKKRYVVEKNKTPYEDVDIHTDVIYTWRFRSCVHVLEKTPREFMKIAGNRCRVCSGFHRSHPELAKYYCEENTMPFTSIKHGDAAKYWWCDEFKHKILSVPNTFAESKNTRCRECNLLSAKNPKLFEQLDHEKNKLDGIDESALTFGCDNEVYWRCPVDPKHPSWKAAVCNRSLELRHCGHCRTNQSAVEKKMQSLLEDRGIKFETQKTFPDLVHKKALKCDFYIPPKTCSDAAIIIEIDGPQHFGVGMAWFNDPGITLRDRKKNLYAKQHGINMLRVDYNSRLNYGVILDDFLADIGNSRDKALPPYFKGPSYTEEYKRMAFDVTTT